MVTIRVLLTHRVANALGDLGRSGRTRGSGSSILVGADQEHRHGKTKIEFLNPIMGLGLNYGALLLHPGNCLFAVVSSLGCVICSHYYV